MNNHERLIASIPPALIAWLILNQLEQEKKKSKERKILTMRRAPFLAAAQSFLIGTNPQQHKVLRIQHVGMMKQITKYFYDEVTNIEKALMLVIEWTYSLHDAGVINIQDDGYEKELRDLDEYFGEKVRSVEEGKKIQKSVDKHMLKFHKIACKVMGI